jgi:hypothetical protein
MKATKKAVIGRRVVDVKFHPFRDGRGGLRSSFPPPLPSGILLAPLLQLLNACLVIADLPQDIVFP